MRANMSVFATFGEKVAEFGEERPRLLNRSEFDRNAVLVQVEDQIEEPSLVGADEVARIGVDALAVPMSGLHLFIFVEKVKLTPTVSWR